MVDQLSRVMVTLGTRARGRKRLVLGMTRRCVRFNLVVTWRVYRLGMRRLTAFRYMLTGMVILVRANFYGCV